MSYSPRHEQSVSPVLSQMAQTPDFNSSTLSQPTIQFTPPKINNFEFVTSGVLITSVSVVGIFSNIVALVVLLRPQMRSSVNCVLQGLAGFDIGLLITAFLMLGIKEIFKTVSGSLHFYNRHIFPLLVPAVYPLAMIAQTGSIWSTVAVTVERYVAVCHPLRARSLCTYNRARMYNVFVFCFALVYNIPRFFEIERRTVMDSTCNCSVFVVRPSDFRQNSVYFEVYYTWMYLTVMYFLPFATLAILNVHIWKSVRLANENRQMLTRRQQKDMNLAVMLLCVVAVFFVSNALAPIANFLEYTEIELPALVHLSNLLVTLNSSVNFFIYCILGRKFKQVFLETFCGRCRKSYGQAMVVTKWIDGNGRILSCSSFSNVPSDIGSEPFKL